MKARERMPAIEDLQPFDTCLVAGRLISSQAPVHITRDNILAVMDQYGIAEALVTTNFARLHRTHRRGNLWTVEFCRLSPRLHPVWVLEPPLSPGRDPVRQEVAALRAAGVRVVRLLMGAGASAPLLWWWQELLAELDAHRLPCLVDFGSCNYFPGATNAVPNDLEIDRLREIVLAFPRVNFILSHASGGLGIANSALPLMARCANLHLDITGILEYWRRAAHELGPERVFFATGAPYYDPATLIGNVQYEPGLSPEARRLIMGGNIRRLMKEVV